MFDESFLREFWEDSDYGRSYAGPSLTEERVRTVEAELGFRLPAAYVELMKSQNGGIPTRDCFPTDQPTSWAEDHVAITGIYGIGREPANTLLGKLGSVFMQEEWGYPTWGICICTCPSAGHDMIMLDYRVCGPQGEPSVVHVDQESNYRVTPLAGDFEAFVRGLVREDDLFSFEDEAEIESARRRAASSPFSAELRATLDAAPDAEQLLRAVFTAVVHEKTYLALHADPLSHLVYDLVFDLYATAYPVAAMDEFFGAYPSLIQFDDGDPAKIGYVTFVQDWAARRLDASLIVSGDRGFVLADAHRSNIWNAARALVECESTDD